ncbi:MAG TPA: SgcJ/EcaC family oxidoreductase [Streptosporangiaceae bacterium]|nr:SgcJ/EcaC family oxidoreductase [Streptosporangiaceae bacterium]
MSTTTAISTADQAAISDLLQQMRQAWEHGDGNAYAAVFTDDAHYVNAPGQRVIGADAIAATHQHAFGTFFRNTHLGSQYPSEIEPIAPGVVIVHSSGAVLFAGEDETKIAPNGLMTMVMIRRHGVWKITSFTNTQTGRGRNIRFLGRYLRSRLHPFTAEWSKARRYMLDQKEQNMTARARHEPQPPKTEQ